jgi:hypothetical protein
MPALLLHAVSFMMLSQNANVKHLVMYAKRIHLDKLTDALLYNVLLAGAVLTMLMAVFLYMKLQGTATAAPGRPKGGTSPFTIH